MRRFPLRTLLLALALALGDAVGAPDMARAQGVAADEEVVFDIRLRSTTRLESAIGVQRGDRLYVALSDVITALDFPIVVSLDGRSADGFFIAEDRGFRLDLLSGAVTVEGETRAIAGDAAFVDSGVIFVSTDALARWFPLRFDFAPQQLALTITPDELLPVESGPQRLVSRPPPPPLTPQLPPLDPGGRLIGLPTIDLTLSQSAFRSGPSADTSESTSAIISATGDVAYGTARFFGNVDREDGFQSARLSWERADLNRQLFGPAGGSRITLGDVTTAPLTDVMRTTIERGAIIEQGELGRRTGDGLTEFIGEAEPGFIVELYRNGGLIESQDVGGDGLYAFRDVRVFNGRNVFELRFLGPQGQRRSEFEELFLDELTPDPGQIDYQAFIVQDNKSLLLGDIQESQDESGAVRAGGSVRVGLTDTISARLRGGTYEIEDERFGVASVGLRGSVGGAFGGFDYIQSFNGGAALTGDINYAYRGVNFRLGQKLFFNEFRNEDRRNAIDQTDWETDAQISSSIALARGWQIPLSLSVNVDRREDDTTDVATRARQALLTPFLNLQHSLTMNDDPTFNQDREYNGSFSASRSFGPVNLRLGADYEIDDGARIEELNARARWRIASGLVGDFGYEWRLNEGADDPHELRAGLTYDAGFASFSGDVRGDTEGAMSGFLTVRLSAQPDPRTNIPRFSSDAKSRGGAASVRVFIDENNNGAFDEGEPPAIGAKVRATQQSRVVETDEDGIALFTNLREYVPTDIEIAAAPSDAPFTAPRAPGRSVDPAAGRLFAVDYAVVNTGDVDGFIRSGGREANGVPNVPVRLRDAAGAIVTETRSEQDGFYIFEAIRPGEYRIDVAPDEATRRGARPPAPIPVVIGPEGSLISGLDIALRAIDGSAAGPQVAQRDAAPRRQAATPPPDVLGVQIGSYRARADAERGWAILRQRHPALLGDLSAQIVTVDLPRLGRFHRLIAVGLPAGESPSARCARMKRGGLDCRPARTRGGSPAAAAATANAAATGGPFGLQIAAYADRANAEAGLRRLRPSVAGLFAPEALQIEEGRSQGRRLFRLRAYAFADASAANAACASLKARGGDCLVIRR